MTVPPIDSGSADRIVIGWNSRANSSTSTASTSRMPETIAITKPAISSPWYSALPLSIGGAALALVITGCAFSLPVVIGLLMLMGIVAKNSILLVDFAIEEMRAGKDRLTALLEAGHKRARPIVMTSVAMIAGMLPLALGLAGDASLQGQMAIAVIGGLVTSTALTLVMVPAAFTLIDDFELWLKRKLSIRSGAASDASVLAAATEVRGTIG